MNLHGIAQGYVAAVNPPLMCSLEASTGYGTDTDGSRVPTYATPVQVLVQCQALSYTDLQQISGLDIQGKRLAMYVQGTWNGIVRDEQKGGDIITLPDGTRWLAAYILENWGLTAGWTKIVATQQNNLQL